MSTKTSEKLVQCPYDKLHKVREDRLQFHLIKCKRQNLDKNFVICPFNTTHHMPKEEFEKHAEVCPDRKILLRNSKQTVENGENCHFKEEESTRNREEVMNYLVKSRQKKVMKIKETASNYSTDDDFDEECLPMGVMVDPNLPPDIKYSRGRGVFLKDIPKDFKSPKGPYTLLKK